MMLSDIPVLTTQQSVVSLVKLVVLYIKLVLVFASVSSFSAAVQHDTTLITTLLWEVIARHVAVTCVAMRADFSAVIGLVTHVPSITARNYP